jgi:hypothetical protein
MSSRSITKKEDPMPVYRQKKCTTTNATDSTQSGAGCPKVADQQQFHQHLRELARSAIRVVLEAVMREELDALIGAAWGEGSSSKEVSLLASGQNGTFPVHCSSAFCKEELLSSNGPPMLIAYLCLSGML